MKKIRLYQYIILISCLVLGTTTCQREEEVALAELSLKNEQIEAQYTTARLSCAFECNATFKNATIHYATNESFEEYLTQDMKKQKDGSWATALTNLINDTVYFVRYVVANSYSSMMAEQVDTFHTKPYIAPIVANAIVIDTTAYSALISGKIESDGGLPILSCGICYSTTSEEPILADSMYIESTQIADSFVCELTNLTVVTTYYARAYATNSIGTSYSDIITFTTLSTTASLGAISTTEIGLTSATIAGEILADGGSPITDRGVCYSLVGTPTVDDQKVEMGTGIGSFTCELTDLAMGTTYYVCLYAINANGTVYSAPIEFTTTTTTAEITTSPVSDITSSSAITGGTIHNDGGEEVIDRGICYATSESPTIENSIVKAGQGTGTYECTLSDLLPGTTYYVRAYASNNQGTAYGNQEQFTTLCTLASVTTTSVTYIALTEATVGGDITSDGGSEVTERGICYSTKEMPSIEDNKEIAGSGTGTYSCNLKNLLRGTTYYVRAYAINSEGIAYGNQISFSTSSVMATVETATPTEVGLTNATVGGKVTDDGGSTITEKGICYGQHSLPTIADKKVPLGEGLGAFTHKLTNLTMGATYYVRAYATNANGTNYGESIAFTMGTTIPSVNTSSITNITISTATVEGDVSSDGGSPVLERGICYSSTNEMPTIEDSKVESGTGIGIFTCELIDLALGTTYYVRAYAKNLNGINYGEAEIFTTGSEPPIVTTADVSDITMVSVTVGGEVVDDRGSEIIGRGVCYATTQNPTTDGEKVECGKGIGVFMGEITGLQPGTKYFVRAYATNENGTSYGAEKTFMTTSSAPILGSVIVQEVDYRKITIVGNIVSNGGREIIEYGICYSDISTSPSINDERIVVSEVIENGMFSCKLTGLQLGTSYYIRSYAINEIGISYSDAITISTKSQGTYIDLGLSVKWANCNLGAMAPEEYGFYYAWGETETKDEFTWETYKYCQGTKETLTKYCIHSQYGIVDNLTTLELSDDAAYVNLGGNWRMPTSAEINELYNNCTHTYTTYNGIQGHKFTSKKNGNSIFLPLAGNIDRSTLQGAGENSKYWSSSLDISDSQYEGSYYAYNLYFWQNHIYFQNYSNRYVGFSIRPVYDENVSITLPNVSTLDTENISSSSIIVKGNVTSDGNTTITSRGICYSTLQNPTLQDLSVKAEGSVGEFSCTLVGLTVNTTYYARAYATNSKGTAYGNQITFKTTAEIPTITTTEATNVTSTSATIGGNISSTGGSSIISCGICYSTNKNPTIADKKEEGNISNNSFTCILKELVGGTTYYVRAFAENEVGIAYGNQVVIKTTATAPTIINIDATNITSTSAILGGRLLSDGGSTILKQGICYSTDENPSRSHGTDIATTAGINEFTCEVSNLTPNTTYYYRAYAVNNEGTSYAEQSAFTTTTETPVLSSTTLEDVQVYSAILKGTISSNGGDELVECGICYSTNTHPTWESGNVVVCEDISQSFTCKLKNLTENTTYFARAYARNHMGIAYSDEISFKTLEKYIDLGLSVKWANMNIGAINMEDYGEYYAWGEISTKLDYNWANYVHSNGTNDTFTKYCTNVDYGNVDNKTILDYSDDVAYVKWGDKWRMPQKSEWEELISQCQWTIYTKNGINGYLIIGPNENSIFIPFAGYKDGNNYYSSEISYWSNTLDPNVGYSDFAYYIAGQETDNIPIIETMDRYIGRTIRPVWDDNFDRSKPEVITIDATDITHNTVIVAGNVISDGGVDISERGVCYSTSSNPTINDKKVTTEVGIGEFSCTLINLTDGETYYARAYATNSLGTTYGNEITFTTIQRYYENGYEYIDLGLPSGLKWATYNLGASHPYQNGDYFAWGEIDFKDEYSWSTYTHCNGTESSLTKYNTHTSFGSIIDGLVQLETVDDAANYHWKGDWRIPTREEFQELYNECTWEWTTVNGTNGYMVIGPNGQGIFLPAAGYIKGTEVTGEYTSGYYWSATLESNGPEDAYMLRFSEPSFLSNNINTNYDYYRYYGRTIRPVLNK